jgi:outer membrane murein-binding lipoprotein Lpp
MEFLKALFTDGEALTYDQLVEKANAAKINAVNLAAGGYISQNKYDDKVRTLTQQVETLNGQIAQRDTDMADLQGKLTAAQADGSKLSEVQTSLTQLQGKYDADKKELEDRLAQQAYEFAVREKAGALNFSSTAAKKAFIQEAIGKGFKQDGDTLLGYEDFVTKYKADDPGAFVVETPPTEPETPPAPQIVLPSGGSKTPPDPNGFHFAFNGVRPQPKE